MISRPITEDSMTILPRNQRRQKEINRYFFAEARATTNRKIKMDTDINVDTGEKSPVDMAK